MASHLPAIQQERPTVYDMYHWDQPDPPARGVREHSGRPAGGARRRGLTGWAGPAAQAVQVALDRRDNGGDSSATRDQ